MQASAILSLPKGWAWLAFQRLIRAQTVPEPSASFLYRSRSLAPWDALGVKGAKDGGWRLGSGVILAELEP
jgi:hypothetical protein